MKNFEVNYTKKNGQLGIMVVKGKNEKEALNNAKFNCFTGSDFFVLGVTQEKSNASNNSQAQ